jgi:hypothetical protein
LSDASLPLIDFRIPKSLIEKIQGGLKVARQHSILLPTNKVEELVALLDENIQNCSFMDANTYEVVLEIIFQAGDSRIKERGVFILAVRFFQ